MLLCHSEVTSAEGPQGPCVAAHEVSRHEASQPSTPDYLSFSDPIQNKPNIIRLHSAPSATFFSASCPSKGKARAVIVCLGGGCQGLRRYAGGVGHGTRQRRGTQLVGSSEVVCMETRRLLAADLMHSRSSTAHEL